MALDNNIIQAALTPKTRRTFKPGENPFTKDPASPPLPVPETNQTSDDLLINKALANREQTVSIALATDDYFVSKPLAIREHSVSDAKAKREQPSKLIHKAKAKRKQSVSNALAQPLAAPLADREQCVSEPLANVALEEISGLERQLLIFIFHKCRHAGALQTQAITTEELRNHLNINAEHLRNLIYRLTNKTIIEVIKTKNGRAGWRKFGISQSIHQTLILSDSVSIPLAKREQTVSIASSKALAEPLANVPSSSSYIYNKTTTNLPDHYKNIELAGLENIGFTTQKIEELAKRDVTNPDKIQRSIYALAYDLEKNNPPKTTGGGGLLNFLIGILNRGDEYTARTKGYEDPIERELKENIARATAQKQKLFNLRFEEWLTRFDDAKILEMLPTHIHTYYKHLGVENDQVRMCLLKKFRADLEKA